MAGQDDYYNDPQNQDLGRIMERLGFGQGQPTDVQTDGPGGPTMRPEGSLAQKVAMAIAGGVGGAAGGMGADARPPETTAPAPASSIRYYDDRQEKPNRSMKEMALMGLIPLGAGILGGLATGNKGALLGVQSGLEAVGNKINKEDDRYAKVSDQKELNRSQVVTARMLKELGGKDGTGGGSVNKVRYAFKEGINTKTGEPLYLRADKQGGGLDFVTLDGKTIPYTAEIYKNFHPTGDGTIQSASPAIPAAAAPATPAAGPSQSTTPGYQVMPYPKNQTKAPPGVTKTLPNAVKQPGGSAASQDAVPGQDLPAPAIEPGQEEAAKTDAERMFHAAMDPLNQMKAEAEADMSPMRRQLPDGTMESLNDVHARVKEAGSRHAKALSAQAQARADYLKIVAAAEKQAQALQNSKELKQTPGAKPIDTTGAKDTPLIRLKPNELLKYGGGRDAVTAMNDLDEEMKLDQNKNLFGPIKGTIGGLNKYDEPAQKFQSNLKAKAQMIGKFMESGVLRKEDEIKYQKMLPQLDDQYDVALGKNAQVRRMLENKHRADISALKAQHYDTSGLEVPELLGDPVPKTTGSGSASGSGSSVWSPTNIGDTEPPEGYARDQGGVTFYYSRKAHKMLSKKNYDALGK